MLDTGRKQGRDIMTWTPYLVSFKLRSPVHIGWKKIGNLQVTRPYITGKTLWGALTARLVRDEGNSNYSEIGKQVDDELRFTYFYPSASPDKVDIWPWDKKNEFAWKFLGSYVSTAIEGDTVEEGSLHEVEYISPTTRDGNPVFLVGYVIEKKDCHLKWMEALKHVQIGGERGYGWGRTELLSDPKPVEECFGYRIDNSEISPMISIPKDNVILAHAKTDFLKCIGYIEPFLGRETNDSDGVGGKIPHPIGGKIPHPITCYTPGSKVVADTTFVIQPKGVWEKNEVQ